ncbi:MAG: bifunctional heptose 7-phosphate kinase/heptose 1-phosphate adenyltransferase, partial [Planctomycetes bacterium]|nr:bifunctional heptose 7-phosphate kinase/heptose 1-phosphate adenyltransferase [Planctomycetota bacterium]
MYERLLTLLDSAGSPKVLLVGDFMLDNYVYGNTDRISPEAPVVIINVTERHSQPGGAGSVAVDLAMLGVEVACLGVIGNDSDGNRLCSILRELKRVNTEGLITAEDRPTTMKQRIIGLAQHRHRQQLMRIDDENQTSIDKQAEAELFKYFQRLLKWCDIVCLEDYNKGVLGGDLCQKVIQAAKAAGKRVVIDPASVPDYQRYSGAWLIKPNRIELSRASGIDIDGDQESLTKAAEQLTNSYHIDNIVVTLDKRGAFLYQGDKPKQGELVPTRPRNVYDVTGAGDMVLAMLALLAGGRYESIETPTLTEMVCLANVAGGLEVERFGSVGISREEIADELNRQRRGYSGRLKLRSLEALMQELQWLRQQKLKIVFTNGCFDILHPGHIHLLSFAKQQGDILIVAINSDQSVRNLKGPTRPILAEQERATILSALEAVDYIV